VITENPRPLTHIELNPEVMANKRLQTPVIPISYNPAHPAQEGRQRGIAWSHARRGYFP
jgi:hypothetical protein